MFFNTIFFTDLRSGHASGKLLSLQREISKDSNLDSLQIDDGISLRSLRDKLKIKPFFAVLTLPNPLYPISVFSLINFCFSLSDNIFILGFERDREKIYSSIDVLIDPAHGQGISNANLEAMSSNTLLIASEVEGNIDLITNGETGLLFNPRKKGSLLEKLIYYKKNPQQVKIMLENARKKIADTHNINSITHQILDFVLTK